MTGTIPPGFPPSLEAQVGSFLSRYGPMIPGNALYVVDARYALGEIGNSCGSNTACISRIIQLTAASFAGDIHAIDSELETAGAKNIFVWDVPNIGKTPAALAAGTLASMLGTTIASAMNQALRGRSTPTTMSNCSMTLASSTR